MPQKKQGGITVDAAHELSVPATAHVAMERSARIDKTIPKDHTADSQPYHEYSGHPALKHLKSANHVHEVFKKR
jgi:hypothetical protein